MKYDYCQFTVTVRTVLVEPSAELNGSRDFDDLTNWRDVLGDLLKVMRAQALHSLGNLTWSADADPGDQPMVEVEIAFVCCAGDGVGTSFEFNVGDLAIYEGNLDEAIYNALKGAELAFLHRGAALVEGGVA